jgi:hypothetical protein
LWRPVIRKSLKALHGEWSGRGRLPQASDAFETPSRHTSASGRSCLLLIDAVQFLDGRHGALHIASDEEPQELPVAPAVELFLQQAEGFTDDS